MINPVEAVLLVLILGSALATVLLQDVLASIIAFAGYSLAMAVLWLLLRAPDVALTEAAIGAGVTTVILLVTISKTVRPSADRVVRPLHLPTLVGVIAFAAVLLLTVPAIPAIGDPTSPAVAYEPVSQYYLEHAYEETGIENAVTAVLAAYRGFDTFGEAVVVFTAGVAVLLILREEVFT